MPDLRIWRVKDGRNEGWNDGWIERWLEGRPGPAAAGGQSRLARSEDGLRLLLAPLIPQNPPPTPKGIINIIICVWTPHPPLT